jgi:hypothetical protein
MSPHDPLRGGLRVINLGLERFALDLRAAGVEVVHVDWRPPGDGDVRLAPLLLGLDDDDVEPGTSGEAAAPARAVPGEADGGGQRAADRGGAAPR